MINEGENTYLEERARIPGLISNAIRASAGGKKWMSAKVTATFFVAMKMQRNKWAKTFLK